MSANKFSTNLIARFLDSMSAEDLQILANEKLAKEGKKPGRKATAKTETKSAPKPTVVESAPKARTNVAPQILTLTAETREGKDVLILKEPGYNYRFVKGWYFKNVIKPMQDGERAKGTGWKFVDGVRIVPAEDFELLMTGLRDTYAGSKLVIGDKAVDL